MGPYVFGNQHADICDTTLNRILLVEFCRKANLLIANTIFEQSPGNQVTYYELSSHRNAEFTYSNFAQIDFFLMENDFINSLQDVWSDKSIALRPHHFLVLASFSISIPKVEKKQTKIHFDLASLAEEKYVLTSTQSSK